MSLHKNICFLFVLLLITAAGCKNKTKAQKMNEKFNWTGTVSAPEEYPMEVYEGAIIADDFTFRFDEMWGTQNTGWGETGGVFSIDREQMDAPDSLKFTWLSLIEKKFYSGSWKLNKDKIARLFREGFVNDVTHKKDTYKMIKVGLAPKGLVVVWLSGTGFQTEVGSYQATETALKKDDAYENAKFSRLFHSTPEALPACCFPRERQRLKVGSAPATRQKSIRIVMEQLRGSDDTPIPS